MNIRLVSIPDLVGLVIGSGGSCPHKEPYHVGFNPRFGGVGDWITGTGTGIGPPPLVSIPDLVGLVIGCGVIFAACEFEQTVFQSPIWWGW